MGVELVSSNETVPVASSMAVADAYRRVRELVPGSCSVEWSTEVCPGGCGYESIVKRFTRALGAEAWLVARPLDGERGVGIAVIEVSPDDAGGSADELRAFEDRLRAELDAAKLGDA